MRRLGGTEQPQHSSQKIFCFVHLNFALGLVDFCQRLCPPQSCQTKEETDHRPETQGRRCVPCCTAKKQEAPGGSLSSTRAWAGPKAGQSPPHQPCCAVQSSGALCTLQSQLGVTEHQPQSCAAPTHRSSGPHKPAPLHLVSRLPEQGSSDLVLS